MKNYILLNLLLFGSSFYTYCVGQKQEDIAKFIISESSINGKDNTPYDLNRGGYFIFYTSDNKMYFANVAEKTDNQSFGRILNTKTEAIAETATQFKQDKLSFTWNYRNNWNKNNGYATIILTKIYKPQGILFEMGIVLTNLDLYEYKGYMEGTLNFETFLE